MVSGASTIPEELEDEEALLEDELEDELLEEELAELEDELELELDELLELEELLVLDELLELEELLAVDKPGANGAASFDPPPQAANTNESPMNKLTLKDPTPR